MRLRLAILLLAVLFLAAGSAFAAPVIPAARGYVNDTAGLLSPGARQDIVITSYSIHYTKLYEA